MYCLFIAEDYVIQLINDLINCLKTTNDSFNILGSQIKLLFLFLCSHCIKIKSHVNNSLLVRQN